MSFFAASVTKKTNIMGRHKLSSFKHTINMRKKVLSLLAVITASASCMVMSLEAQLPAVNTKFVMPANPRITYNMNPGWKFIKEDAAGADAAAFDDSKWTTVSTPHTYNDVDSYDEITAHGEKTEYMGIAWYRKHFKLPAGTAGSKVFIEFEGMKQAGHFFVNGKPAGKYENGVTACGIDITDLVNFGDKENVLAVKIDNSNDYKEEGSGIAFQWMSKDFNPNYGGIHKNVWMHITGKVYQTLPLYDGLKTKGIYVYPKNISVSAKTADIAIESEVKNESGDQKSIDLSAVVVDANGIVCATMKADTYDMVSGESNVFTASGKLANARFWDVVNPYLYDVYTMLTVDGKVVDVCKIHTGFRKAEYKGGAGKGGIYINDKFVYLKGYAQRSTNEWAGLGQAYPDWMHDFNADCIRASNGNYIRWMHIAPSRADVSSCDKYGIVQAVPAGDKEKDSEGRQWEQRKEVMRNTIIYFRNNPSVLMWEGGNNGISGAHMKEMHDLRVQWDPNGGRAMGCRTLNDSSATPIAEYFGVMIGQDPRTDKLKSYTELFRAYSAERRDKAPLVETEDFREEGARRFWDNYTPPHFGFKKGPTDVWDLNSETFAVAAVKRYDEYYQNMISNTNEASSKWSGYASIIFADSNSHGRQYDSEVCRVSGKMDAVRIPKPIYFAHRVLQNDKPDISIIGHWTYPAGTKKNVYVVANCESVELLLNGKTIGKVTPTSRCLFTFTDVTFEPGTLKAIGYTKGKVVCQQELATAGAAKSLRLTVHQGPKGLQADGADVAFVDVEVVDDKGNRCPTDEARVDFDMQGPAIWRGGYNSGIPGSTNNTYLLTECGINRVSVRATLTSGTITLTAKRDGLTPATIQIKSMPVTVENGLSLDKPQTLTGPVQ
jgi:beta-galactosidase